MTELFLIRHSLREFLRMRRLLPWIVLSLGALVLAMFWGRILPTSTPPQQYGTVSSMIVFRMLALASAIFTTAIISQEVEQKTIVYLLTRPVPRWKMLLSRYVASVLVVVLLGLFGALMVSIGVYGLGGAFSHPLLAKDALAIVLGAFAYGALFLLISLLFNRSIIICLLFAFGWEAGVANMPGDLYYLSIFSYMQAVAEHPSEMTSRLIDFATGDLGMNLLTRAQAIPVLLMLTALLLLISAWWFTRFEYVPREDAE
jgi:ABC-2 type transport system permease protein